MHCLCCVSTVCVVMTCVVSRRGSLLKLSTADHADALSPDKTSQAADKLKESLRIEGVLDQLVHAALHCALQQDQAASCSQDADADRYRPLWSSCELLLACAHSAVESDVMVGVQ